MTPPKKKSREAERRLQAEIMMFEDLIAKLGMTLKYDDFQGGPGGYCRLRDEKKIIINRRLIGNDRLKTLCRAVSGLDLEDVYILPRVRELLEEHGD